MSQQLSSHSLLEESSSPPSSPQIGGPPAPTAVCSGRCAVFPSLSTGASVLAHGGLPSLLCVPSRQELCLILVLDPCHLLCCLLRMC